MWACAEPLRPCARAGAVPRYNSRELYSNTKRLCVRNRGCSIQGSQSVSNIS